MRVVFANVYLKVRFHGRWCGGIVYSLEPVETDV
jgi:hypothetical protein